MEARGSRQLTLALAGVTAALLTARTACQSTTATSPRSTVDRTHPLYGSRVAAILVPCLVAVAIAVLVLLAMGVAKLRKKRCSEGAFCPRRLRPAGGSEPPVELNLTAQGLTSGLLLSISLLSVVLLLLMVLTSVGLVVAFNRRATHGTYSPSRQEKEGSRVEMWSISQPPPMERLI